MFGFGKKPDHCGLLTEYLIEEVKLKPRLAGSFIATYGAGASARLEKGLKGFQGMTQLQQLEARARGDDPRLFALIAEAYHAYLIDVRTGRIKGSDNELALWAILWNRTDLLESFDKALAAFIDEKQPELFPDIDLHAFAS